MSANDFHQRHGATIIIGVRHFCLVKVDKREGKSGKTRGFCRFDEF